MEMTQDRVLRSSRLLIQRIRQVRILNANTRQAFEVKSGRKKT